MRAIQIQEHFFRIIISLFVLATFFIYGIITGYQPIIGFVFMAGLIFMIVYYYSPPWFGYLYIFTVSFAALLHLPVTEGGFSSAVAIALSSFGLGIFGALMVKDKELIKIFFGRIDQILPFLFFMLMIISMMNSKELGFSAKQIQQFLYIVVTYYFLNLTIRNRENFRKAFFILLLGGICVGLFGVLEVILQTPTYSLLGNKSLLGASISDALLNAKAGRINGLIGDAPFHGVYMTMIASVSLYYFFTSRHLIIRILYIMVFLISVFNVMGTGSRGAFIALLLALFIFWAFSEIAHKSAIMMTTFLTAATLVIVMVILIPNLDVTRSFTFEKESTDTAEMRWENIPVAIKMFGDHPIIGNGPDGFVINYTRYASGLTKYASREKTLKTHNTPLQILAEYGLVGIILFGLIIFMSLKRMVTIMRKAEDRKDRMIAVTLIAAISAYIFFMATSNTLLDKYFWLLITFSQIHYSVCSSTPMEQQDERY